MPIIREVYEGTTDALVFPLIADGQPLNLLPPATYYIALILSGLDGRLAARTIVGTNSVSVLDGPSGLVQWYPAPTDLLSKYGPYRLYFQIYKPDGTFLPVPQGDYYLISVVSSTL